MKNIILYLILFLVVLGVSAQESGKTIQTIKGKVIDETTNEPVSYTNIGLEGTYTGTASDADGNFELKIPEEHATKNIFFSAVGFQNRSLTVSELNTKGYNVIKLQSQSYDIENIDVAAQSKVLIRILRMASENTPYNFLAGPFNLICTYENSKISNDSVQTHQKANITVYDKNGYTNPSKTDAFESVKYTVKNENENPADYRFSTGLTNLDEILELDWIRTGSSVLNPALLNELQLTLEDEPVIDGKKFWVIAFKQDQPTFAVSGDYYATFFEGKITVAKDDYSVKKIEAKIRSAKNSLQGRSIAVSAQSIKVRENVDYDFTVSYSGLKPDEIILNKNYSSEGQNISEKSQLKINQVQTTNITSLQTRDYFTGR